MQRQILINVMIFFAYALNLPLNTQRPHHRSQRCWKTWPGFWLMAVARYIALPLISRYLSMDPTNCDISGLHCIGEGQRSSHATHLLMLVIICIKYGKNPSRTVDATERTRFSRPRPNDLEDIGQGQRSLYATHSLILVIICIKYGNNPSRTVDFFFQGQGRKISKIC